jgi:RNA recognition motif-containing protein
MNIYVGYLPDNFTDEQLKEKFATYGKVYSAKVIIDRETGLSKGFGFVEMKDDYEGQLAIDNLLTWEVDGKRVKVNKAKERERTGSFGGGFDRDRRPGNNNNSRRW